jgi:membrane protein DedA with SNARE-associated domain
VGRLWVFVGYLAGDHIGVIYGEFQRSEKFVLAAFAVLVIAFLVRWVLKYRSGRAAAPKGVACRST